MKASGPLRHATDQFRECLNTFQATPTGFLQ